MKKGRRRKVRCYWAGFLVQEHMVHNDEEEKDLIESLKIRLASGQIVFRHIIDNILTELCVDVVINGKASRLCDLKK